MVKDKRGKTGQEIIDAAQKLGCDTWTHGAKNTIKIERPGRKDPGPINPAKRYSLMETERIAKKLGYSYYAFFPEEYSIDEGIRAPINIVNIATNNQDDLQSCINDLRDLQYSNETAPLIIVNINYLGGIADVGLHDPVTTQRVIEFLRQLCADVTGAYGLLELLLKLLGLE